MSIEISTAIDIAPAPARHAQRRATHTTTSPDPHRRTTLLAIAALLFLTATWGSTYFMIKDILDRVPAADFLAVRFAIAALALFAVAPKSVFRLNPTVRKHAVALGVLYALGMVAQTAALAHTSASVSGFITTMYIVMTPLMASVLLRTRVPGITWASVALATLGLAVLTLNGFSTGLGELVTLGAAVLFALHIVGLSTWSTPSDAIGMTIIQVAVIAVVCAGMTVHDGIVLPSTGSDWASVLYMALVVSAGGLLAQTWAQSHLDSTRSALIMSVEPVFASAFAIAFGGELLTGRLIIGGALVITAMLVVELSPRRHIEGEVVHIAV